ncbi:MAG TPA: siphovirus Gp157 family protein [Candidatus Limnocylindrales bacterium]|nr:siphovirus Gp157 family protein [Candidatus Limnocylindrales bacterium]
MAKTARALPALSLSPNAQHRALLTLRAIRDQLLAIDPSIIEDVPLFTDTLDGEGGDALDILSGMVRAALDAETMVAAIRLRKADLEQRAARFEKRNTSLRRAVLETMQDIGLPRLEREDFTATVGGNYRHVIINDDKVLPDDLVRVTRTPDKTAIGARLKDGEDVPGAVLSNAESGLTIRVR